MILRFFIIFYICAFRRLTIAVTPKCQTSSNGLIITLTCIDVTNYVYKKWYDNSPCRRYSQYRMVLYINNSNLPVITKNFTDLLYDNYNCNFNKIEITNSKIKAISRDAFQGLTEVQKLNISFNEINNLDFLLTFSNNYNNFQHLDLNNNKLIRITASNFTAVPYLKTLSIGYNNLYTIGNSTYNLEYLIEFNLNNNNLSAVMLNVFSNLRRLEILNLANNYIKYLNSSTSLNNLKVLNLNGNKIIVLNTYNIYLNYNRDLVINLYLQNNPLSLLINETYFNFHGPLFMLDLSQCKVVVLEDIFKNLTSLKLLKLTDSPLRKIAPNAFGRLTNLKELDLSNNQLTTLDEHTFTGLKNLTTLDLSNNPINLIFQAFSEFKNLFVLNITVVQHFAITNNTFYNLRSVREISFINSTISNISGEAFSKMDELNILRLESTAIRNITSKAFHHLSFKIIEYNTGSNTLLLSNNFIRTLEDNTFFDIYNINDIEMNNNSIENINPEAFKDVNMVPGKGKINLANNKLIRIADDTFLGIAYLQTLLINNNKLTTIGSNAFRLLNDLELLDLSHNNLQVIDDKTFSSLKQLKLLNLTQNKITTLSSTLFVSLVNLKTLVLNNNDIKKFPLGTFKHLSSLTDLYLGGNQISEFQIGSFSNLVSMISLDLSNNNLIILNETVLYPLRNLQLLNLADNEFSILNYTSLLFHLRHIRFISVNNNNWNCEFLTKMLNIFRIKRIDYLFNKIGINYDMENIEGIPCHQNIVQVEVKNNTFETKRTTMNNNNCETHKEVNIERKSEKTVFDVEQTMHSSEFSDHSKGITLDLLILFVCIGLLLLQIFSVYKKYYSARRFKNSTKNQNGHSEIELLNIP